MEKSVVMVNEAEFELDIFDLKTAERFEAAVEHVYAEAQRIQKEAAENGEMKISDAIRMQCNEVFQFFDTLFGKGAAKKIFGNRVNLIECIDVFEDAIRQIEAQKAKIESKLPKTVTSKKPAAQRRAKK